MKILDRRGAVTTVGNTFNGPRRAVHPVRRSVRSNAQEELGEGAASASPLDLHVRTEEAGGALELLAEVPPRARTRRA